MHRGGLDRFKKAQSLEPFSVSGSSTTNLVKHPTPPTAVRQVPSGFQAEVPSQESVPAKVAEAAAPAQHVTQVGGGQSMWQPPDWAIEPRPGVYFLEVLKDGEVLDRINLDKRKHIFGRQVPMCDYVLDHQSISRQHAAVVPHRNGSIYVIDLGSAHGTFVANERLTKEMPVELEAGQSLRFAASTRVYVLRKNTAALFPKPKLPEEMKLPSPPDPSDEEAVVAYNTILNRYGISKAELTSDFENSGSTTTPGTDGSCLSDRPTKRIRKARVSFKDQVGGSLVEVVGISDGADVDTEPGPLGVKEGSLVGKYESLVQTTVILKGKEPTTTSKEDGISPKGVTDKLQQVLNKVKSAPAPSGGIYDDLFGDPLSSKMGSSWAYKPVSLGDNKVNSTATKEGQSLVTGDKAKPCPAYDNDDLFGDDDV